MLTNEPIINDLQAVRVRQDRGTALEDLAAGVPRGCPRNFYAPWDSFALLSPQIPGEYRPECRGGFRSQGWVGCGRAYRRTGGCECGVARGRGAGDGLPLLRDLRLATLGLYATAQQGTS